jgi:hypothetical protein
MMSMLPGPVFAVNASVTLTLSADSATAETSITAWGSADPDTWVSVKILDSSGNIVFYDAVKSSSSGNYSCTFKVPPVPPGTLTVVAGYGSNVANKALVVTKNGASPGSGGGGGGGGNAPAGQTVGPDGGTVNEAGVVVSFPADAISGDIKVTVKKLTTGIPEVPSGLRLLLLGEVYEISSDGNSEFNKPVTITLPFDPSKIDSSQYDLGIYYWQNGQWIILDNIVVDAAAGTVSGEVNHFSKFAVLAREKAETPGTETPGLKDIAGHWAEANIIQLVAAGAVKGYPEGTFKPDNTISRAEFATILVKAFKLEARAGKVFNDTADHWAKDFIAAAAAEGIVTGYSDTSFGPDDSITREQMAVMIAKAAELTDASAGKDFADGGQISDWAKEAVARAGGEGIISGYPDNTFRPRATATRAEAVTVIVKAL